MPSTPPDYRPLLKRYLRDELSVAEAKELFDFIAASPDALGVLLSESDNRAFEKKLQADLHLPEHISLRMHQRLVQQINMPPVLAETATIRPKVVPFKKYVGWAAAAAALVLLFAGSRYFFEGHTKQLPTAGTARPAHRPVNDAMPGKNGAVLTLADGTQVVLDSLGNGVIATQGKTEVKLKDGQLLYDENGEKLQGNKMAYNTMTTPKGRQYELVLGDGTKVWLNAASSLRYPTAFAGNERKVEITGEAYFEVTKNPAMPFKVSINHAAEVEVLGTHFNINAYSDEASINTTLLEGSVKITSRENTQLLAPGQQAQVTAKAGPIRLLSNVDLVQVMAWKNGAFSFTDADLPTVMRQLGRWYDVDVQYAGAVPHAKFNGEIGRNLTLSQVLNLLTQTRIKYKIENGSKIIVLPDE